MGRYFKIVLVALLIFTELVAANTMSVTAGPQPSTVPASTSHYLADDYIWASGSIKTYMSDGGRLDSIVYYYVRYRRLSGGRLHISHILAAEPSQSRAHLWAYSCYNGCRNNRSSACQWLPSDTWAYTAPNWTVTAGKVFRIWVTNSVDCSGYWGETWTGQVTLR